MVNTLDSYLDAVRAALAATPRPQLAAIADALWATYARDGTIFSCGNGGSAATASHLACDLQKWTISLNQRRVRALALTDNVPLLSAWSNDSAYEHVFVEQLRSLYRPGDTLIAISGSGNSQNVLNAVAWANAQGAPTLALTGFAGGELAQIAQVALIVPCHDMPQVEDVHMTLCHALAVELGQRIAH